MKYIDQLEMKGKRVFLRVDFNVPMDKDGNVTGDKRVRASIPTINYALEKGAKLIIASHLGRPKGKRVAEMSLALSQSTSSPSIQILSVGVIGTLTTSLRLHRRSRRCSVAPWSRPSLSATRSRPWSPARPPRSRRGARASSPLSGSPPAGSPCPCQRCRARRRAPARTATGRWAQG